MVKDGYDGNEIKPLFGTVNFERRKHPRISVNLPIEYWQADNSKGSPGCTVDISEGGLLLYLREKIEVGQNIRVKLFIGSGLALKPIDAIVQVVWNEFHYGENDDHRTGVKFVNISLEDMDKLRNFLETLKNSKGPLEVNILSRLLSDLGFSKFGSFSPPIPKDSDEN